MIVSASRRTDIPAFYSDWFFRRLEEGYLYVKNPMNPRQVSKILLSQDTVACFVFWTKDPGPMMERLSVLAVSYHLLRSCFYMESMVLNGKSILKAAAVLQSTMIFFGLSVIRLSVPAFQSAASIPHRETQGASGRRQQGGRLTSSPAP